MARLFSQYRVTHTISQKRISFCQLTASLTAVVVHSKTVQILLRTSKLVQLVLLTNVDLKTCMVKNGHLWRMQVFFYAQNHQTK